MAPANSGYDMKKNFCEVWVLVQSGSILFFIWFTHIFLPSSNRFGLVPSWYYKYILLFFFDIYEKERIKVRLVLNTPFMFLCLVLLTLMSVLTSVQFTWTRSLKRLKLTAFPAKPATLIKYNLTDAKRTNRR
jgi:hypothetical protein